MGPPGDSDSDAADVPDVVTVALGRLVVVGGRLEQTARTMLVELGSSPDNFAMDRVLQTIRRLVKAGPADAGQQAESWAGEVVEWTLQAGEFLRARNKVMHVGPRREQEGAESWAGVGRRLRGGEVTQADARAVLALLQRLADCERDGVALRTTLARGRSARA
jgi:hypothetical protein